MWLLYGEILALILVSFAIGCLLGWLAVRVVVRRTAVQVLAQASVEVLASPPQPGGPQ